MDAEGFQEDKDLMRKLSKNVPKKPCHLKRDLDARAISEEYRSLFRLPSDEKLDGTTSCCMWTPYNKKNVAGTLYLSNNYVCFKSKVRYLVLRMRMLTNSTGLLDTLKTTMLSYSAGSSSNSISFIYMKFYSRFLICLW